MKTNPIVVQTIRLIIITNDGIEYSIYSILPLVCIHFEITHYYYVLLLSLAGPPPPTTVLILLLLSLLLL